MTNSQSLDSKSSALKTKKKSSQKDLGSTAQGLLPLDQPNPVVAIETPDTTKPVSKVQSVAELNQFIRGMIEGNLQLVWVKGELSNFKAHSSGHFYFSLKDSKSQIRAVMFRGYNSALKFRPTDGLEVIVRGRVTVYEPRGEYQIAVETMEPVGAGALQKAFEQLKIKLKAEGLFDASRKRPIPKLPRHIALVTSPTGAAIQDMLNILKRRNPLAKITLVPTIVQGESAAPKICSSLRTAWSLPEVDVVIVGRGGGSIEDMWCFNDETLARTIAACPVPVISAVGHEIDFTIADFVADLRAPTPSAAAELVVSSRQELIAGISAQERLLVSSFNKSLRMLNARLALSSKRLIDPKRRLSDLMLRNDELGTRLQNAIQKILQLKANRWKLLSQRIPSPQIAMDRKLQHVNLLTTKLHQFFNRRLDRSKSRFHEQVSLLNSLSPLKTVERGYSITRSNEKLVGSIHELRPGDRIEVRIRDGDVVAIVDTLIEQKDFNLSSGKDPK